MTPETMPGAEFLQPDKLFDHHRQQLSAMMDGALAPDQARFLLRRLQHDTDLTACWERWQLAGDVLRGDADALLSRDFAQRIAIAIAAAAEAPQSVRVDTSRRPRWAMWGGGTALAASVAVAALLVLRPTPDANDGSAAGPARTVLSASPTPVATPPSAPATVQQTATTRPGTIAVAELSPRNLPGRSRGQSQRAALRNAARRAAPTSTLADAVAPAGIAATTPADPFASGDAIVTGRPWPRAIGGPNAPASGGFTVGLGSSAAAPSFYPFQPPGSTAGPDADEVAAGPDVPANAEGPPPH